MEVHKMEKLWFHYNRSLSRGLYQIISDKCVMKGKWEYAKDRERDRETQREKQRKIERGRERERDRERERKRKREKESENGTVKAALTLFGHLDYGGGGDGSLRVFAKYLKNGFDHLDKTLWLLRLLYRSSFKIKSLRIGHHSSLPW